MASLMPRVSKELQKHYKQLEICLKMQLEL